jgi:hypothetical protein
MSDFAVGGIPVTLGTTEDDDMSLYADEGRLLPEEGRAFQDPVLSPQGHAGSPVEPWVMSAAQMNGLVRLIKQLSRRKS